MHRPSHQRDARTTGGSDVRVHMRWCEDLLDRSPKGSGGAEGAPAFGGGICDSTGQDTDRSWEDDGAVRYLEVGGDRRVLMESWRRRGHRSDQTRRGMQLVVGDLREVG